MDYSVDPQLIEALRRMFFDGATASQLMKHVVDHQPDGPPPHFTIMRAFEEAFGVGLVRYAVSDEDYTPDNRHAQINRDLIPEMVAGLPQTSAGVPEGSWLDGLSVTPLRGHVERLKDYRPPEMDRIWDALGDRERAYVRRLIATKDYEWQVMKVLAALAERLQAKVAAAEARHESPPRDANGTAARAAAG